MIQMRVLGVTNIEGSACLVLEEPYPLQGQLVRWVPKLLQPFVLYSDIRYECLSFDRNGNLTPEVLPAGGSNNSVDPPPGEFYFVLPDTTNRWQVNIQNTQSLRIKNVHLFDFRSARLVTAFQEPTLPKKATKQ